MSNYVTIELKSAQKIEFIDISAQVRDHVRASKCGSGILLVFTPHTTAAVTINENADPAVPHDIGEFLKRLAPKQDYFRHGEGNSPAHIMSSLVGASEILVVNNGEPILGSWQGIFFCEFDGPRQRRVFLKVIPG
ncbi:MAG: secondary thiamine-phosphate synthase enzyme YjbQ [Acidobacteria bacterium]|jgi:secondary thiamine-phosphate synthase enzyme|nr:secondary thiamine-phosphate synthase enzyme YjbQ [Acidobacteriota bacterium]